MQRMQKIIRNKTKNMQISILKIKQDIDKQLASKEVMNALIGTTFKGLNELSVKQAIMEGVLRGFMFKDFLEKNVYAIPFSGGYSLITSIDYARKIGMKSGVVGKSAPIYETVVDEGDGKESIVACTITIKKQTESGYVGDFTETVYFNEYTTGKNQWLTKPRTMIAKVAEMHALRQACPEELAKAYVEEEFEQEAQKPSSTELSEEDKIAHTEKLESATDLAELATFWANLPGNAKIALKDVKESIKAKLTK